jgi:hypothetical protein
MGRIVAGASVVSRVKDGGGSDVPFCFVAESTDGSLDLRFLIDMLDVVCEELRTYLAPELVEALELMLGSGGVAVAD